MGESRKRGEEEEGGIRGELSALIYTKTGGMLKLKVVKAERSKHTLCTFTHSNFVLSRQVGPFTQQLGFRQREHTGRFSDQHRVVQLAVSGG